MGLYYGLKVQKLKSRKLSFTLLFFVLQFMYFLSYREIFYRTRNRRTSNDARAPGIQAIHKCNLTNGDCTPEAVQTDIRNGGVVNLKVHTT